MTSEMKMEDMLPLILEGLENNGEFIFFPRGISMLPTIVQLKDRVRLTKPENIKKYSIVLYRRDNSQFVLHRVVKKPKNGIYTMCGDNQRYLERGIKQSQIIAAVSDIIHENDKMSSCTGLRNSVYAFAVRAYRFAQRACTAIKRRIHYLFSKIK